MLMDRVRHCVFTLGMAMLVCHLPSVGSADEVLLDDRSESPIRLGDFECSSCPGQVTRSIGILDQSRNGEVYAGELWQFFHDQGVVSLDRLTLCVDVEQVNENSTFDLQSVELTIEDPTGRQPLLTHVSLGDNSLVVPYYETSSFKPEAKLEIFLGYDFMQRFSADSREKVKLDFSSNSVEGKDAKFIIEADSNVFSKSNFLLLFGFVAFWVVVFVSLNRITKPETSEPEPSADTSDPPGVTPKPSNRALSA
jgi:hypothetical protein